MYDFRKSYMFLVNNIKLICENENYLRKLDLNINSRCFREVF
jgi:hypothetical protein